MLMPVPNAAVVPSSPTSSSTRWFDPGSTPRRLDGIEVRLRRLVDSSEPAVVFSSLVRLCVPAFNDACSIDIVEGGRVRYRVSYPQPGIDTAPPAPCAERSVVTAFESGQPGWATYTGVMTSLWHTRSATAADEERAADIVEHAIRLIRGERLAARVRSSRAPGTPESAVRAQLRSC